MSSTPTSTRTCVIDLLIGPIWTRLLITRDPITADLVDDIVDALIRAFPAPATATVEVETVTSDGDGRSGDGRVPGLV